MKEGTGLSQQERLDRLTPEERAEWGFLPGETIPEAQERTEKENPSRPSTAVLRALFGK